ncbi:MAG TPA: hypothetical protein VKW77_10460, partial [Acidimicrobiales bacterium]|nr:hypothetical protein [Acidimicrobiales bacterium]
MVALLAAGALAAASSPAQASVVAGRATTPGLAADALAHPVPGLVAAGTGASGGGPVAHDNPVPVCTFDGASVIVPDVTPGAALEVSCTGWSPFDEVTASEFSPLLLTSGSTSDLDPATQTFAADAQGDLSGVFTVPDPFAAPDPAASCPPTSTQIAEGYLRCGIVLADAAGQTSLTALDYAGVTVPPRPVPAGGPPTPAHARGVGIAATPYGAGYWVGWSDGTVTDHGDAYDFGDASTFRLYQPIAHIHATRDGFGYWLVAADGGVFAFGDAGFYGSTGGRPLDQPVVDMTPTPDGGGYWLVAADGGVFSFGDATFHGSMGGERLNAPVVGMAADTATGGYWLVAADGGVFAFDAPFLGSTGGAVLARPVVGMVAVPGGGGYFLAADDGGVFAYGDAAFAGSAAGRALAAPVVGMTLDPLTRGYWLVAADGGVFAFD